MQKAFKAFCIFVVDTPVCAGRQWSIMPEFYTKVNYAIFTKKKPLFCAFCTTPRIGADLFTQTHICFNSHCRPSAAAQAGIRRSVPHMEIFLLKAGRRSVCIFSRIASLIRSGPICSSQNLKPPATFKCSVVFYLPIQ